MSEQGTSPLVDHDGLLEEVQRLVRIPSYAEVETIAGHVLERLREAGIESAHRDEDGNVIGEIGEGEGLLLNAHLDTVGVDGFAGDPCAGRLEGEWLIGRGASDCKAGVATLLEIARRLARRPLRRRLMFAFTIWEEGSAPGPNGAYGAAARADASGAIVLESTVQPPAHMEVRAGCNGILRLDLTVHGKSCHSSTPAAGDNALYRAAEVVQRFRQVFAADTLPQARFNLLGQAHTSNCVASLTQIEALQGRNIIPDRCRLGFDCRLVPGQDADAIRRRLEALAAEFGPGMITIDTVASIPGHVCQDRALLEACRQAAVQHGFQTRITIGSGRTDSTIFQNEGGIPTVIMGPGTMGQAHTSREGLHLPAFQAGAQACLDAVVSLVT